MRQCIKKEFKIMLRQKGFFALILLFTVLYCIVGVGICNIEVQNIQEKKNLLFYYMYIYPMAFVPYMLQYYPIAKEINELSNGGVENLLCTPCGLNSLIMGKVVCIFGALMVPSFVMIVVMSVLSKMWLISLGTLFFVSPLIFGGISLMHITSGLKKKFQKNTSSANFVSVVVMLCLTYLPMISEKVVGYVWDYRFSLGIAVIIAIIIFLLGIISTKNIEIENII